MASLPHMAKLLPLFILLFTFVHLGAQSPMAPAELEQKIVNAKNDSDRVKLLLTQVKALYDPQRAQNIDEVIKLNNRAIVFAEKINYLPGLSKCYSYGAKLAMLKMDPASERSFRLKLDKVSLELNKIQNAKLQKLQDVTKEQDTKLENAGKELQTLNSNIIEKDRIITGKDTLINRQKLDNMQKEHMLKLAKQENELKDARFKQQQLATRFLFVVSIGVGIIALILLYVFFWNRKHTRQLRHEKERSDKLLRNILPSMVADELKEKGSVKTQFFNNVTVLFSDFKGFTSISEKLSPEDLVRDIDQCYRAFDEIVERNKLEKIKTIGDAYMCAGGLPERNTGHTLRAVKAALEMVEYIERHKQERKEKGLPYFEVRIGLHCGPVVAGVVGIHKFAYDIWGDVVNTAARMESSSEAGRVNVSKEVFEWVKNHYQCVYRGKVQVKNKGEVDMYFVEGISSATLVE